jgi:hypothetical protein
VDFWYSCSASLSELEGHDYTYEARNTHITRAASKSDELHFGPSKPFSVLIFAICSCASSLV